MKFFNQCLSGLALLCFVSFTAIANTTIFLAGDSTVQDVNPEKSADMGWGQRLPEIVSNKNVFIDNHAKGGRSTRTFIEEGRWERMIALVNEGDWVFLQFGHNDQAYDYPDRYTSPKAYYTNLNRFISDIRQKKANPVLITPVSRRYFDKNNELRDAHGMYPEIVRVLGRRTDTPVIDLTATSWQRFINLGPEKSKVLFNYHETGADKRHPEGISDDTHFSPAGSLDMAKLVVAEIQQQKIAPLDSFFTSQQFDDIDFETPFGFR